MNRRIASKLKKRGGCKTYESYWESMFDKLIVERAGDTGPNDMIYVVTNKANKAKRKRIIKLQVLRDCMPVAIDNGDGPVTNHPLSWETANAIYGATGMPIDISSTKRKLDVLANIVNPKTGKFYPGGKEPDAPTATFITQMERFARIQAEHEQCCENEKDALDGIIDTINALAGLSSEFEIPVVVAHQQPEYQPCEGRIIDVNIIKSKNTQYPDSTTFMLIPGCDMTTEDK